MLFVDDPCMSTQDESTDNAKVMETSEPTITGRVQALNLSSPENTISNVWTLASLIGQKRMVADISIGTDSIANAVLFRRSTGLAFFETFVRGSTSAWSRIFTMFRFRTKFTFQVESSWQHVGSLLLYYHPVPAELKPQFYRQGIGNDVASPSVLGGFPPYVVFQLDNHQLIRLGHNGTYTIESQWESPLNMLEYLTEAPGASAHRVGFDFGEIILQVFVPLTIATGVNPQANIRVWGEILFDSIGGYNPTATNGPIV